jgi:hypothetical protein
MAIPAQPASCAAVLADLIRRPWDTSEPAVTTPLHATAPLAALAGRSAESTEVNVRPVTAAHVGELLARLSRWAGPSPPRTTTPPLPRTPL